MGMSRSRHIGVVCSGLIAGCVIVTTPGGNVEVKLLNKSQAQAQSKEQVKVTTAGNPVEPPAPPDPSNNPGDTK